MPDASPPPPPPDGARPPRWRRWSGALVRGAGRTAGRGGRAYGGWARRRWTVLRDPEQPWRQRVAHAAALAAGVGATIGAGGLLLVLLYAAALYPFTPSVETLARAREVHPSVVLSADGVELTQYARFGREWVSLDEVAPVVVDALISVEDRRFYEHGAIDWRRLAGAVLHTLTGDVEGGSTITQQLARNLFPEAIGNERSLTRKLKEALTAYKIERVYTKDEILEIYLNTVPFLYDAVGIERAAQTYFSTSADDLTTLQAATLVGMLKGTSYYNPRRNPERSLRRRTLVLALMVRNGKLSAEQFEALKDEPLGLDFERQPIRRSRAPHVTEHVRVQLEAWARRTGHNLYGDGLRIHTTLDWRLQQAAQTSVSAFGDALQAVADVEWSRPTLPRLGETTAGYVRARASADPFAYFWRSEDATVDALIKSTPAYRSAVARGMAAGAAIDSLRRTEAFTDSLRAVKTRLEVGFVAVDPRTGWVKAWVGSRDWRTRPFDHVAGARRQPGSTFKPFVYGRALEEGWAPDDRLRDEPVEIRLAGDRVWAPTDPGGPSGESLTLSEALTYSKNTVAAQLIDDVGARDVARFARRAGITSPLDPVPSLALGTSEVSLLELTSAYATLAAAGVRRTPTLVTRIESRDGETLAEFVPDERQAMSPEVALATVDMMRGVVDRGTGRQLRTAFGVRGDVAGKTGTTQDGADGWFLMVHPELVAGAWVGFDDPRVTFRSSYWEQGGHNALRVVGDVARTALRDGLISRGRRFDTPDDYRRQGNPIQRAGGWLRDLFERDGGDEAPGPVTADADPPDRRRDRRPDRYEDPEPQRGRSPSVWDERIEAELDELERTLDETAGEVDADVRAALADAAREAARAAQDEAARAARDALDRFDPRRQRDPVGRQLDELERRLEEGL